MSKVEPLISIALCTFNGQEFLAEQLESILSKSYGHLEVIVGDDGSTDDAVDIVEKFAALDPRIKLYRNPEILDFKKNFERAIFLSSGDYIVTSDQDDIWETDKINLL